MENPNHKKFYEMTSDELEESVRKFMKYGNIKALNAAKHHLKRTTRDDKMNSLLSEIDTYLKDNEEEKKESKPESEKKSSSKPEPKKEPKAEPKKEPEMTLNQAILHDFVRDEIKKDEFEFTASQEAEIKKEEEARKNPLEEKLKFRKLNEKTEARLKKCQDVIDTQEAEIKKIQLEQRKKLQEAISKDVSDEEINKIRKEFEDKIENCKAKIKDVKNTIVTLKTTKSGIEQDKEDMEKQRAEREASRLKEIQEQIKREKEAQAESQASPVPPIISKSEYETEIEELKDQFLDLLPDTDEGKDLKTKYIRAFDLTKVQYQPEFAGKEITPENKELFDRMKRSLDTNTPDADKDKKENFMKNFDQFVTKYYGYVVPEFNKDIDKIKEEFYSMLPDTEDKTDFDEIFKNLKDKYDSTIPVPDKITDENKKIYANLKSTMKTSLMDIDETKRDEFFKKYDSFVEKHFGKEEPKRRPDDSGKKKTFEKDYSTQMKSNIDELPTVFLRYLQHAANSVNYEQAIKNAGNIQEISDDSIKANDYAEFAEAMNKGIEKDNEDERMVFKGKKGLRAKLVEMKMRYKQRKNLGYGIVRRIVGYKDEAKLKEENKEITRLIMMDIANVRSGRKPVTKYVKNLIKENKKKLAKKEKVYAQGSKEAKLKYLQSSLEILEKSEEKTFTSRYEYGNIYYDKDGKRRRVEDVDGKTFEISIDQVKEALEKQIEFVKEQKEQDIADEELGL